MGIICEARQQIYYTRITYVCKQGIYTCLSIYLYFSVCCLCMQCMITCVCECRQLMSIAEARGGCQHPALSISTLLFYFLKMTSLDEPRAMSSRDHPFPTFHGSGTKGDQTAMHNFLLGFWDLNSGSHACTGSALT